jgi:cell division protein FtsW
MRAVVGRDLNTLGLSSAHRRHRPDYILLILMLMLLGIGVIVVYAISPALAAEGTTSASYFVTHQILAIILGLVAFVIIDRVPIEYWQKLTKPLLILSGFATLLALVMPVNTQYPAHRWIRIGTFSFQSVELLKFALIIWLAGFLAKRIQNGTVTDLKMTLKPLGIALVIIGVIVGYIQSDLGSVGVIIAIMGSMIFVAGMPIKKLMIGGAIIAVCVVLLISVFPYRRDRLLAYLHPASNCASASNNGYQECQALIAVGSGGMIGLGLGRSVQAYGYLPEADNDSIFAIYAEKFGFIGDVILISIFAVLFYRLKSIIERAPDDFSRLYTVAILAWLAAQTIINIGAMIGLLPLKGITLPLISYGGTSVVFIMAALGVVFRISRYTSYVLPETTSVNGGGIYEDSRNRRRFRGAHNPSSSSRS